MLDMSHDDNRIQTKPDLSNTRTLIASVLLWIAFGILIYPFFLSYISGGSSSVLLWATFGIVLFLASIICLEPRVVCQWIGWKNELRVIMGYLPGRQARK
jgi:predicted permease